MPVLRAHRTTLVRTGISFLVLLLISGWAFSPWPGVPQKWLLAPGVRTALALATAQGDGLIIYGVSGNTTPQWRTYTASSNSFGAETGTVAGSAAGTNFALRTSPTKQEAIAGYTTAGGVLQVMCYDGTSWTNEWSATVGGTGTTRRFDIAYETNSGDVLVLYSGNVGTTNELRYRTKLGSAGCGSANWSAEQNLNPANTSGVVHWVKVAWDRRSASNLIAAIWGDANADLGAMIWSGTAWGNEPSVSETSLEVAAAAQDVDDFDVEYESSSGDVMVVWANSAGANGTNGVRYRTCTGGTSACTWGSVTTPPTFLDDATHLDISANPASDEMIFTSVGNAGSDAQSGYWSGSAWTNTANVDTATETPGAGAHYTSSGWVTSGATTRGVLVYHDSNDTVVSYRHTTTGTWTPAAGSAPLTFSPTPAFAQGTNLARWYEIERDPFNTDRFMLVVNDSGSDLFAKRLVIDATPTFTWTNADGGAALNANLSQNTARPWAFAYWRFIPPTPTVSCDVSITSTDFGTLTTGSVTTASPNASTTMSCSNTSAGCTLSIADTGNGSNPGLATTTPAYLIPSPDAAFNPTAVLAAGTEGYGITATTTAGGSGGSLAIYSRYNVDSGGNTVGGLKITDFGLASSSAAVSNRQLIIKHKAAISGTTQAANYVDTITYSCTAN